MKSILGISLLILLLLGLVPDLAGQSPAQTLEVGKGIERELKGGESHLYRMRIEANQFLSAAAEQKGIDVVVILSDPTGTKVKEVDSPNGTKGIEPLWYVTVIGGDFQIDVRSLEKEAKPGRYKIKINEIRSSTPEDEDFVEGQLRKAEGDMLMAEETDDSVNKAFSKYEESAKSFRKINDVRRRAAAIFQLGKYDSNRRLEIALGYFKEALELYKSTDSKRDAIDVLLEIGLDYDDLQKYAEEVDAYKEALKIAVEMKDVPLQSKTLNQLGVGNARLGDFNRSLENFEKAYELNERLPWSKETSVTLMGLANVYNALGNAGKAIEYSQRNIKLLEANGEQNGIPGQLLNIGGIYLALGNLAQATVYNQKALEIFESHSGRVGTSYALANLGDLYALQGKYSEAISFLERSRQLKTKFLPKDPDSLSSLARVYALQGNYTEAIDQYQKSLEIFEEINGLDSAARILDAMSAIFYLQGEYAKSLESAERAIAIAKKFDYPNAWASLSSAGYAKYALGRKKDAQDDLIAAIRIIESLRSQLPSDQNLRGTYVEKITNPYQMMVAISAGEKNSSKAFGYAERYRARTLVDVLQSGRLDISKSMSVSEREHEQRLKNEMSALNSKVGAANDPKAQDTLRISLEKKRLEQEDFLTQMSVEHPELRTLRGETKTIVLQEAFNLIKNEKSALIEFIGAADKTFLFTLTKSAGGEPTLDVITLHVTNADLTKQVEALRLKVAAGDINFKKESRQLFDLLLKPAANELAGKTDIVIVPDGPLWNLPFHALIDEKGTYLAEKMAVSYAPSLTALREMQKKARTHAKDSELIAFGNPFVAKETSERVQSVFMGEKLEPIPDAERLVNELGKMYGARRSKVYTGANAREATAKLEAPKYRIVQFATHGILNDVSPMYSHLVMAQDEKDPNEDGLLEAWELKDLDLKADMVILSACDTARGRVSAGEGMIGMTWAAFIAGAPTTVASQWKVESSSTTELMLEFHRQLLSGKVSKAEALRRAQLKLMRIPKYKHPLYWAGWVIVGDGS
ncbi:MAG: hypothetical protein DMF63_04165 [Acidobacteria bacterium]|nr:MAG: hypothetical protein DMF63_04165 [Acidobacteriota bacterium]